MEGKAADVDAALRAHLARALDWREAHAGFDAAVQDLPFELLVDRPVCFGIQTRIDLWKPDMIRLLGAAGCVSVEAGVESLTPEGRDALDKKCRMSTDELTAPDLEALLPLLDRLIENVGTVQEFTMAWKTRGG